MSTFSKKSYFTWEKSLKNQKNQPFWMKKILHVETVLKSLEFVAKKSYFTWEICQILEVF